MDTENQFLTSMIVDVQGVVAVDGSFLVKELTAIAVDCTSFAHWLFKHPKIIKGDAKTNSWLKKHLHGMDTRYGDVEYDELPRIMKLLRCETIYVKGAVKKTVVEKHLPGQQVINMEDLGCPPLNNLSCVTKPCCIRHMNNPTACSLYKSICLKHWLALKL